MTEENSESNSRTKEQLVRLVLVGATFSLGVAAAYFLSQVQWLENYNDQQQALATAWDTLCERPYSMTNEVIVDGEVKSYECQLDYEKQNQFLDQYWKEHEFIKPPESVFD